MEYSHGAASRNCGRAVGVKWEGESSQREEQ